MPVTAREKSPPAAAQAETPQLLLAVYVWRYVTPAILQHIFAYSSLRTARHHLHRLAQNGYLKTTRPFVNHANVYSLTAQARRRLTQHYPHLTFLNTREESIRPEYLNHELAISRFQLYLHQAADAHPDLTVVNHQRRYFHADHQLLYTDHSGQRRRLEPDLTTLLTIKSHRKQPFTLLHFGEIDRGTESPTAFYKKLVAYTLWHEQAGEQYLADLSGGRHRTFRLLITTQARRGSDHDRLQRLYHQARGLRALHRRTYFTTEPATAEHNVLTDPIWYRLQQTPLITTNSLFQHRQ